MAKSFQPVLGSVHFLRKLKSDNLLVEISIATQSKILPRSTKIGSFSVSIVAHKTLNVSCGVTSVADLLHSTNEEFREKRKCH